MIARELLELKSPNGGVIRGRILLTPEAMTTVVICHGFKGFSKWGFFPYLTKQIALAGFHALSFNFSGSGIGADGKNFTDLDAFEQNTYTRELDDLATVEAEARRRGWLGPSYGLVGHSRGGGMAVLHAASSARVGALVTWSAIADVGRWPAEERARWRERGYGEVMNTRTKQVFRLGTALLDEVEQLRETRLNIQAAAGRLRVPWLIVHGTADETVPFSEAERLRDAAAPGVATLLPVEGASHTFGATHPMSDPPPPNVELAARATVEFLRKCLRPE